MTTNSEITITVPLDHPSLAGHFPGKPIVPGVVILDYVVSITDCREIQQVKFKSMLYPGETCVLQLQEPRGTRQKFSIVRDEEIIAIGSLCIGIPK